MEVKLGYKQTEVGIIPDEWEVMRLDALADIRSGGTPSTAEPRFWDGNIPWCTPTDITAFDGHKYLGETARMITQLGLKASSAEMIPAYSVVMTSRATIGECAINAVPVSTNQGFKNFVPFATTDVDFLYYLLGTQKQGFISLCGGSTFLEIGKKQLVEYKVGLPSAKTEQRAIATALSDMDGLLGALDRLIAKKRDLKQAAMQQLLTGQTRLPGFHGEWELKRLDEVADVIDPHPSHRAPIEVSNGVPFVGIGDLDESGNIVGTKLRYVDRLVLIEHAARYNLDDQLIGLGRVASIGKVVCLNPQPEGYAISPTLGIIRGRTVKRGYLLYALRSKFITEQFIRVMSGSTRSSVGMEVLRKLHISLPPTPEEQNAIAEVLTDMDAELAGLEQRREKTRALKQAMMQELLTGRTRLI